jgi:hypothetical protein
MKRMTTSGLIGRLLLLVCAAILVQQIPDIARYAKIKSM